MVDILNLSFCSKYFNEVCRENERFNKARELSNNLVNKHKDIRLFLEGFLDDFYKEIKEDVKKLTRKSLWLPLSVMISDFVETLSPFKIFCHVFHCKRGFNVLDRCRYWTRVLLIQLGHRVLFKKVSLLKNLS